MRKSIVTNRPQETRINVRVKGPMAAYLESVVGPDSVYENQSEYIRDLIRHDMADQPPYDLESGLLEGYAQLADRNYRKRSTSEIIERAEREMREEDSA